MTDTAHAPVEPNVLSSSRDVAEQLLELDLIQVYRVANKRARQYGAQERDDCGEDRHVKRKSTRTLLRDTGEEDGPGLGQLGVRVRDEVSLTNREPVLHLDPDVVEDPDCGRRQVRTGRQQIGPLSGQQILTSCLKRVRTGEEVEEDEVSSVALLLVLSDVSESESGEAVRAGRARVGGIDREQDDPREEPDREEDLDDHAQEEQVAVGIRTVLLEHLLGIGVPEGERPAQEGGRHGRRALRLILGDERPRLVDGSEVASNEGEGDNLDSCDGRVEDEGRHKGLGRGRRSVSANRKKLQLVILPTLDSPVSRPKRRRTHSELLSRSGRHQGMSNETRRERRAGEAKHQSRRQRERASRGRQEEADRVSSPNSGRTHADMVRLRCWTAADQSRRMK